MSMPAPKRRNDDGLDAPHAGTWKLKSLVREISATGEKINQQGEHPNGYLSYSAEGRMIAIVTSDNRVKPRKVNPEDEERIKLHQTLSDMMGGVA
jgi:hypothetical protein